MPTPHMTSFCPQLLRHQPAEFRRAVLPKLKANIDAAPGGPSDVRRWSTTAPSGDQGKNQLYGEQTSSARPGRGLTEAPMV